ncbi:Hypothetical predicted protein [Mytilus galloprovincialis]|uniref:TRIM56 n=1 Tax=Mytilus galloprovincialis TaxID=29158 RepID=A0A8B6DWL7_MYTGA|nr:Hypothetical predicted protein [Mytilus galloprovincialis]
MAIAQDKTDNFDDLLTCTICLETFTAPKYLPCLHTFCKTCINTYILSTVDKEKTGTTFKCPICRQDVLMGESPGQTETWSEKLPGNHFVASMMNRQAIRKHEKICDSCKANNETKNALSWCIVCEEAFCKSCEKCHKSFKMTATHPIVLLNDLVTNKETVTMHPLIYCEEHRGEVVKAFCVDHSKPLCSLCATLSHRKCEEVITIEKAAKGIKQSEKSIKLSAELRETSKQLSDLIQNRKRHLTDFEKESEVILANVSTIKATIVEHLNKIEEHIKNEIIKSKKEVVLELSEKSAELESLKSTVDNWIAIYDTGLQHGSELQCLLEIHRIYENKMNCDEAFTKCISEIQDISMILEANDTAKDFTNLVSDLGIVKLVKTKANCPKPSISTNVNFHLGSINVINAIDLIQENSQISGLFMEDVFIFTHRHRCKVLKYDVNGKLISELKLTNGPLDIGQIDDTDVVVSAIHSKLIILNIQNMTQLRSIDVPYVHGCCYVNGEFILANGNTLIWINASSGVKSKQIETNSHTYHVHADNRKQYTFANNSGEVFRVANDKKIFTYTNSTLLNPRGIDTDCKGNVYICGYTSGGIHQLDKEGKLVRIIPTDSIGIKQPWVIRFRKNCNQFFVTCYQTAKVVVCEIV